MLRAPFLIQALSHTPKNLHVTWKDGAKSIFPNTWLRSNVRDDRFFEASMTYKYEHANFLKKKASITNAKQQDKDTVRVNWVDHTSDFDTSWLRAQDIKNAPEPKHSSKMTLWDHSFIIPEYSYLEREKEFASWVNDLKQYGIILMNNVPRNEKGLRNVMEMMGPLRRRYHPTDVWVIKSRDAKSEAVDPTAFGTVHLNAHTDHTFFDNSARLNAFLCADYNAPDKDTVSYFINGIKVAEDLKRSDPDVFHTLSTTPFRRARRRMSVEEECDPSKESMYYLDLFLDTPVITTDKNEVKSVRTIATQNAGLTLGRYDEDYIHNFYLAYSKFTEMLEEPVYHATTVLRAGTMCIFDNHRLVHGRGPVHPTTTRQLTGGFITDETWKNRCRLFLGQQSGLADKWLFGCSGESLEILSQRLEE